MVLEDDMTLLTSMKSNEMDQSNLSSPTLASHTNLSSPTLASHTNLSSPSLPTSSNISSLGRQVFYILWLLYLYYNFFNPSIYCLWCHLSFYIPWPHTRILLLLLLMTLEFLIVKFVDGDLYRQLSPYLTLHEIVFLLAYYNFSFIIL